MSEGNGKKEKKRYVKLKTLKVDIDGDDGEPVEYTIKQMLADELQEFEKFKKPLIFDGQPIDGAINVIMNRVLETTLYGPDGKKVDKAFLDSLSFETKVSLSNDSMILTGGDVLAKETAKNA